MRDALAAARSLSATDPEAAYRVVAKLIRELGRQDTHTLSGLRAEQSRLLEACCTGTSPKANARRVRSWRQPESCPYDAVRVFALSVSIQETSMGSSSSQGLAKSVGRCQCNTTHDQTHTHTHTKQSAKHCTT